MPTPPYILDLRRVYGSGRLLLPGVSGVVVRDLPGTGPQLLLVKRADTGRWSLPSGIVEPDEQPATALEREIAEETRVRVRAEQLTLLTTEPELTYPNGDRCQFVSMTFRCRYLLGEAAVGDEESTEVVWFPPDRLPDDLGPLARRRIASGLSGDPGCLFDR